MKLGLDPKKMEVIVSADIIMKGKADIDDLYLIMFNVMDNPLRLSVFTIGNLFDKVIENTNCSPAEAMLLAQKKPDEYIQSALGNLEDIAEVGDENVKIPLDSEENAKKARIVLSSMIEHQHYLQKSKYLIDGEVIAKEQEIDTTELIPQLKMMLEIIKRWEGFDIETFRRDIEGGNLKI